MCQGGRRALARCSPRSGSLCGTRARTSEEHWSWQRGPAQPSTSGGGCEAHTLRYWGAVPLSAFNTMISRRSGACVLQARVVTWARHWPAALRLPMQSSVSSLSRPTALHTVSIWVLYWSSVKVTEQTPSACPVFEPVCYSARWESLQACNCLLACHLDTGFEHISGRTWN